MYVVFANDDIKRSVGRPCASSELRVATDEVLAIPSLSQTNDLPSALPLYVGMSLLLYRKACVKYGLMNGCEVVLEHIVFSEAESVHEHSSQLNPIVLQFLPDALVLRAVGAQWSLPAESLPCFLPMWTGGDYLPLRQTQPILGINEVR